MPYVSGGGGGVISGVTVSGAAVAGDVPVASSAGAGSWVFPPGHEYSYTQITTNAAVTDTAEATATALISPAAFTPDGAAVLVEVYCTQLIPPSTNGGFVALTMFEGATEICRFCIVQNNVAGAQATFGGIVGAFRFTPSAAAHTYKLCGWCSVTTGTPQIVAGAGGAGVNSPAFIRFTKA